MTSGVSHLKPIKHFDIGPEEEACQRNAKRLRVDLASIERIWLSQWHRDHSSMGL